MHWGKRDRTNAKNPPFRTIFSYQCCPQNLSIIRVKIKQHPSTFCQRPHNMAIGFQLLHFDRKVESFGLRLIHEFVVFGIWRTIICLPLLLFILVGPLETDPLRLFQKQFCRSCLFLISWFLQAPPFRHEIPFPYLSRYSRFVLMALFLLVMNFNYASSLASQTQPSSDVTFDVTWGDLSTRIGGAQSSNGVLPIRILPYRPWKHSTPWDFAPWRYSSQLD